MAAAALHQLAPSAIIGQYMGAIRLSALILVLTLLVACQRTVPSDLAAPLMREVVETTSGLAQTTPTRNSSATATRAVTVTPASTPTPVATQPAITQATATPESLPEDGASETALLILQAAEPPVRDDARLAVAFMGASMDRATALATPRLWEVGVQDRFYVGNIDANTVEEIEAELGYISERAYFWFDTGEGASAVDAAALAPAAAEFDVIYENVTGYFAADRQDDGRRVHIVHVSPLSLCSVTLDTADQCRLAGYFSPRDLLPAAVNSRTNNREMFVMNATLVGRGGYLDVLAHELRHMIEARYDLGDEDWAVEGSAMLAAELAGHEATAQGRANLFLAQPDLQLNSWSEGDRISHYGQGYLFSRYLFDRLGEDLYRRLATHPDSGLRALDAIALETEASWSGLSLWLDWLVMLALQDEDGPYGWLGPDLDEVSTTDIDTYPTGLETTVSQFAADYYSLLQPGAVTLAFRGEPSVRLLSAAPFDGERMWYALRDNYANPRLSRTLDLSQVESATLTYAVYADIEDGYDFAYVSISTDGGTTWQPLAAAGMRGEDPLDDPSDSAVGDRFYSGRSDVWIDEEIDLSAYAGQVVELRFEYITDPVLTYNGFALDNIAVPEIGFFDGAEDEVEGWTAEGFVRAPGYLPQQWHVLFVTRGPAGSVVERLSVPESGLLEAQLSWESTESAMLIVAANAPRTLTPARYELSFTADAD